MMIDNTQLSRLTDVGLAAAHFGKPGEARVIFENLLRYRPEYTPARIGLAFTHLVANGFAQAEAILNDVLAANPQDADAQALLGLTLSFSGQPEKAVRLLEGIPAHAPAASLAKAFAALEA
jgi:thioredoxin-like negative regulator of GroEL